MLLLPDSIVELFIVIEPALFSIAVVQFAIITLLRVVFASSLFERIAVEAFWIVKLFIVSIVLFSKSNAEKLFISIILSAAFVVAPLNVNLPLPVMPKSRFSLIVFADVITYTLSIFGLS